MRLEARIMLIDLPSEKLSDVFIAHRAQLRSIALKIVGTADLADEVTQEAYLRVAEGVSIRKVEKPYCYCCQVVRNLARDYCRRQTVEATYRIYTEDGELPPIKHENSPERALEERRLLEAIDHVLKGLPERTRRAFELYRLAGLTQREIAKQLGCSPTLVNFMLKDAVEALVSCRDLRVY